MSEYGKDEKEPQPTEEEQQRPSSSLSSTMSRTSSPVQLQDVVEEETCMAREEDPADKVSTGNSSADVAAGEIVQQRAISVSPSVRVTLRETSELEIDNSETSLKIGEGGQGSEQAAEELDQTPGEVYFFNKKSSAKRVKQVTHKLSGQERYSAKLGCSDSQRDPEKVEQNIMNDSRQTPDESPKLKQTEFSGRNSPTHQPLSPSSSLSEEEEEIEKNTKREKTRVNISNATTELVSVFTQTEWSWFNDMLQYQEMMARAEKAVRRASREIPNSPSGSQLTATFYSWIM